MTEIKSWKNDAIRLLGEKVKAEQERDKAVYALKQARTWLDGWVSAEPYITIINNTIAEIEGKG